MMKSTSIAPLLLLVLSCSITHGFNVGRHYQSDPVPKSRTDSSMPPLFFKDSEHEMSSITISPDVDFNAIASSNVAERQIASSNNNIATATRRPPTNQRNETSKRRRPYSRAHRIRWQSHYDELRSYKAQHGHCLVPQKYAPNPKLGFWVMQQRRQYALKQQGEGEGESNEDGNGGRRSSFNGPEGERRAKLLEGVGFVWRVQKGGPRDVYGEVRRMKLRNSRKCYEGGEVGGEAEEIMDAVDFEKYLIRKSDVYSDEDKRAAWLQRFVLFR